MSVDAGSNEKDQVPMGSGPASYPVTTWSKSDQYKDVVIEYNQDCLGLPSCQPATVAFSEDLAQGVNMVVESGKVVLTGDYSGINEAMQNLIITPGTGNPSPINVKVTATDQDEVKSDFDSFTIPVGSVSFNPHCMVSVLVITLMKSCSLITAMCSLL